MAVKNSERVSISTYIRPEEKAILQEMADKDMRSMASEIRSLILDAIHKYQQR